LINTAVNGNYAVYLQYLPDTNTLNLRNDGHSAWTGGTVGSATILQNLQGTIDLSLVSVSTSGNSLTLTVPVFFKSAFTGTKNCYMLGVDSGGERSDWETMGTWTINQNPVNLAVSPNSGSGGTPTFVIDWSDSDGSSDLTTLYFLINTSINGANAAYLQYLPASNTLNLRNDAGNAWSGGTIGSSTILQNSQVVVDLSGVSATTVGSFTRRLSAALKFKEGFTGNKNLYMLAIDLDGNRSDWQDMGDWGAVRGTNDPVNVSVSPTSGSGSIQAFSVRWGDNDGYSDLTSCYFLVNSTLSGNNGAYVLYQPSSNTISLRNDGHSAWLSATIGSSTILQNSQVSIDASTASTSTPNSSDRILNLTMNFKAPFVGDKNLYQMATDSLGTRSPWEDKGNYTVTSGNNVPYNTSVSPNSGSANSQTFVARWGGCRREFRVERLLFPCQWLSQRSQRCIHSLPTIHKYDQSSKRCSLSVAERNSRFRDYFGEQSGKY
jgi:hypothetical protein